MKSQQTNLKLKYNLQFQLNQFGLNPNDWNLKQVTKNRMHLTHKKDKDFKFCGQIDNKGQWTNLQVLSL